MFTTRYRCAFTGSLLSLAMLLPSSTVLGQGFGPPQNVDDMTRAMQDLMNAMPHVNNPYAFMQMQNAMNQMMAALPNDPNNLANRNRQWMMQNQGNPWMNQNAMGQNQNPWMNPNAMGQNQFGMGQNQMNPNAMGQNQFGMGQNQMNPWMNQRQGGAQQGGFTQNATGFRPQAQNPGVTNQQQHHHHHKK